MENITDDKYIGLVCTGEFNAIPDFKIGELFESFFDNINYNVVKEEENIFVDFTGDAFCDDEPCTILMRFKIESKTEEFEIVQVKVNEDVLNEEETLDLLEDIAYIGGAIIEREYCCDCEDGDCSHCHHEEDIEEDNDDNEDNNDGNEDNNSDDNE